MEDCSDLMAWGSPGVVGLSALTGPLPLSPSPQGTHCRLCWMARPSSHSCTPWRITPSPCPMPTAEVRVQPQRALSSPGWPPPGPAVPDALVFTSFSHPPLSMTFTVGFVTPGRAKRFAFASGAHSKDGQPAVLSPLSPAGYNFTCLWCSAVSLLCQGLSFCLIFFY